MDTRVCFKGKNNFSCIEVKAFCLNVEVPPENAVTNNEEKTDCSNADLADGFLLFEKMETSFKSNIWFQCFCLLNIYI